MQLTETITDNALHEDAVDDLQMRLIQLEQETQELREKSEHRVVHAEMKVEALRAGMIDLDGLKFLDMTQIQLGNSGELIGANNLISQLRQTKPWLFTAPSSSSVAQVPRSKAVRSKLANEMNDEEYRIARANIIKRSAL